MSTCHAHKNLHHDFLAAHWPVFALAAISICNQLFADGSIWRLRYDRAALLQGEIWRILSGHTIHLGWLHLLMNLAALTLLFLICFRSMRAGDWLIAILFCAIGTSLGLAVLSPEVSWYVGLSGILHGLIVVAVTVSFGWHSKSSAFFLLILAAKLVWEQTYGALPGSQSIAQGSVIVDAHLYGAISGLLTLPYYCRPSRQGE